jgi:hypothetical protein
MLIEGAYFPFPTSAPPSSTIVPALSLVGQIRTHNGGPSCSA